MTRLLDIHVGLRAASLLAALAAVALPAAEPPRSVEEAVAIAARLAAAGAGGRADLATEADRLASLPVGWVIPSLSGFAAATPAGANWLRSALDRAVTSRAGGPPAEALAAVVADTTRPGRARALAYAWLRDRDPPLADRLLDRLLDDPLPEFRRDAVERLLDSGSDEASRRDACRRGLAAARDVDQIERIAARLAESGEPVDVAPLLGFIRHWRVSEPFDNAGGSGFAKAWPVEAGLPAAPDTTAWKPVMSSDPHGVVDLNTAVALRKGVLVYASADVEMPRAGNAEVRIGSPCAVIVWVNGRQVMSHEIYHASEAIDQYVAPAEFRAGTNTLLVKCCQNEQTEAWAVDWKFQVRVCDALGGPLATQPPAAGNPAP